MDLCQIIFLFSDLIIKEALILLHTDDRRLFEMEATPNNRNALASHITEDVVLEILHRHPTRSLSTANVFIALEPPHLRQP
jgi:hypothetical protein